MVNKNEDQTGYSLTKVADSYNTENGKRLTTFVVKFPRFILAELNTHRAFSRNSASSRAIPFERMCELAKANPFVPLKFQKDHSGMQGYEYFEGKEHHACRLRWLQARDAAVEHASTMHKAGITKQLCNRLLEPFMWHTAIVSSTEWENFMALRAHPAAEIHFQKLANMILESLTNTSPVVKDPGEWHIPFGDQVFEGRSDFTEVVDMIKAEGRESSFLTIENQVRIIVATARCARVSYLNFDGKDDYVADYTLFKRLSDQGHMSPFEHSALAVSEKAFYGNFCGWVQLRKRMPDENKEDPRLQ